jgi:hypothetical protein
MSASIQRRIDRLAKSCGIDFAAFDEPACPCARERFVPAMPTIMYGEDSWGFAVPLEPCPRCGRARADYSGVLWIQLAACDDPEFGPSVCEKITLKRSRTIRADSTAS